MGSDLLQVGNDRKCIRCAYAGFIVSTGSLFGGDDYISMAGGVLLIGAPPKGKSGDIRLRQWST